MSSDEETLGTLSRRIRTKSRRVGSTDDDESPKPEASPELDASENSESDPDVESSSDDELLVLPRKRQSRLKRQQESSEDEEEEESERSQRSRRRIAQRRRWSVSSEDNDDDSSEFDSSDEDYAGRTRSKRIGSYERDALSSWRTGTRKEKRSPQKRSNRVRRVSSRYSNNRQLNRIVSSKDDEESDDDEDVKEEVESEEENDDDGSGNVEFSSYEEEDECSSPNVKKRRRANRNLRSRQKRVCYEEPAEEEDCYEEDDYHLYWCPSDKEDKDERKVQMKRRARPVKIKEEEEEEIKEEEEEEEDEDPFAGRTLYLKLSTRFVTCEICGEKFWGKRHRKLHKLKVHGIWVYPLSSEPLQPPDLLSKPPQKPRFQCNICSFEFPCEDILKIHLNQHAANLTYTKASRPDLFVAPSGLSPRGRGRGRGRPRGSSVRGRGRGTQRPVPFPGSNDSESNSDLISEKPNDSENDSNSMTLAPLSSAPKRKSFTCNICKQVYYMANAFKRHMLGHVFHSESNANSETASNETVVTPVETANKDEIPSEAPVSVSEEPVVPVALLSNVTPASTSAGISGVVTSTFTLLYGEEDGIYGGPPAPNATAIEPAGNSASDTYRSSTLISPHYQLSSEKCTESQSYNWSNPWSAPEPAQSSVHELSVRTEESQSPVMPVLVSPVPTFTPTSESEVPMSQSEGSHSSYSRSNSMNDSQYVEGLVSSDSTLPDQCDTFPVTQGATVVTAVPSQAIQSSQSDSGFESDSVGNVASAMAAFTDMEGASAEDFTELDTAGGFQSLTSVLRQATQSLLDNENDIETRNDHVSQAHESSNDNHAMSDFEELTYDDMSSSLSQMDCYQSESDDEASFQERQDMNEMYWSENHASDTDMSETSRTSEDQTPVKSGTRKFSSVSDSFKKSFACSPKGRRRSFETESSDSKKGKRKKSKEELDEISKGIKLEEGERYVFDTEFSKVVGIEEPETSAEVEKDSGDSKKLLVKRFRCLQCEAKFVNKNNLRRHMLTHQEELSHICNKCGKGFSRSRFLKLHIRVHANENPFKCFICGKGFPSLAALRGHESTHDGNQGFMCQHCKKSFAKIELLMKHQCLNQEPEELARAAGITLKSNQRLVMNENGTEVIGIETMNSEDEGVNSDENRKFKCCKCAKTFSANAELHQHFFSHAGMEDPHICTHCGRGFTYKTALNIHIKIHAARPPEMSPSKSGSESSQEQETEEHTTGRKKHPCHYCRKSFTENEYLESHKNGTNYAPDTSAANEDTTKGIILGANQQFVYSKLGHELLGTEYVLPTDEMYQCCGCDEADANAPHVPLKRFRCAKCGKRVEDRNRLYMHFLTHATVKAYLCKYCGQDFPQRWPLKVHERQHATDKNRAKEESSKDSVAQTSTVST